MARFFINRPIVAMVIAILTVIVGLVVMLQLPIAQFPEIVPPEVNIRATFPGADSRTLEQSVATPIEEQVIGVDNMNYMYSINSNAGSSTITVNFDVKTNPNIDQVLTQLRTSLAAAAIASRGEYGGTRRAEVAFLAARDDRPVFAERDVRQPVHVQLRLHQPGG